MLHLDLHVNLNEAKIANSYIHCKVCDSYYSLRFDVNTKYISDRFKPTICLAPIIERIDKKELLDKLILNEDNEYGYIILETQQEI